jgi:hypothetical protein
VPPDVIDPEYDKSPEDRINLFDVFPDPTTGALWRGFSWDNTILSRASVLISRLLVPSADKGAGRTAGSSTTRFFPGSVG